MRKFTSMAFATLLATAGAAAFAGEETKTNAQPGPVALSDTQLDTVSAGQVFQTGDLVAINTGNIASNNNVGVQVPVSAAIGTAAVNVLGTQTATGSAVSRSGAGLIQRP